MPLPRWHIEVVSTANLKDDGCTRFDWPMPMHIAHDEGPSSGKLPSGVQPSAGNGPGTLAEDESGVSRAAVRAAIVGIFLLMLVTALYEARTILEPLVSAIVIATLLGPIASRAERLKVPPWLAATLLIFVLFISLSIAISLISAPAIDWIGRAPQIGGQLRDKLAIFDRPLAALRDLQNAILGGEKGALRVDTGQSDIIQPALSIVTPAIGQLLLFFGALFFLLAGRTRMRRGLVGLFQDRLARLRMLKILNDVEDSLAAYMATITVINFAVGAITALATFAIGLSHPLVFAVMAFILNFIPYVGPAVMVIVLFGASLVSFPSLVYSLVAPLFFIALTTIEGHFVTPSIIGRRLTLSALIVFLNLAFWTWLWGPIGAFLAVPLLIVMQVVTEHLYPGEPEPELPK
jgi:predicted PurR-regulated permease PerM